MNVFLVHHADALGPIVDPQRPLSRLGLAQAEWLAVHAHAKQVAPALVWHSGKLRSRQTAEAFLRVCCPFAIIKAVRGLQPGDPPAWIDDALALEDRDVLLVGHMPHLPSLAHRLIGTELFPQHGMIAIERVDGGRYVERWRVQPPAGLA